jgi:hypothetical protein
VAVVACRFPLVLSEQALSVMSPAANETGSPEGCVPLAGENHGAIDIMPRPGSFELTERLWA